MTMHYLIMPVAWTFKRSATPMNTFCTVINHSIMTVSTPPPSQNCNKETWYDTVYLVAIGLPDLPASFRLSS